MTRETFIWEKEKGSHSPKIGAVHGRSIAWALSSGQWLSKISQVAPDLLPVAGDT